MDPSVFVLQLMLVHQLVVLPILCSLSFDLILGHFTSKLFVIFVFLVLYLLPYLISFLPVFVFFFVELLGILLLFLSFFEFGCFLFCNFFIQSLTT